MVRNRELIGLTICFAALVYLVILTAHSADQGPEILSNVLSKRPATQDSLSIPEPPKHKNAYCVFLAEPNEMIKPGQEDYYFTGTRMLIYQLLHDPETRTNTSIPLVVLVTTNVPQWKRDQLTYEGAQVMEVEEVKVPWIKPGSPRWAHVMDKLHIFELVQFDKVLLLDTDMVVTRRLDGVFDDPASKTLDNRGKKDKIADDEGEQPSTYMMAANGVNAANHTYPTPRNNRLNAGFVLFKPSIKMYQYYLSVARIEGRFPGGSPEQDLWNYAHRRDGNMPWTQLNPDWTINSPNIGDVNAGIAALHEKYWRNYQPEVTKVLQRSRWKMEGFFQAYIPPHKR